ncbi:PLC-like phosphodiesterase [Lipomyces arxii]|uniref:PLC-like phosphodiesterase n=1 Tax=Lipomyces arxii TaxID=56418 RepID=UPI0034CEDB79
MENQQRFAQRPVKSANGNVRNMPQAIGHRGFSQVYAENTVSAMTAAIENGADGVETDVHLSSDGAVVISHDPTAKRVFGSDATLIKDRAYAGDLENLRTTKPPYEKMPLLIDLLQLFVSNSIFEDKWLVIDVKADNDVDIIAGVASALQQVKNDMKFWKSRVVLGIWLVKYLPLCEQHLPDIHIMHIGVDISYARKFLTAKNVVGFSIVIVSIYSNEGYKFIQEVRAAQKAVFVWTVNTDEAMRLCIALQIDAVLTDNPVRFTEVRQDSVDGKKSEQHYSVINDPEAAAAKTLSLWTRTKMCALGQVVKFMAPLYRQRYE